MNIGTILLFITFCGLVGIFLRRNILNIQVSFLQIICGLNALGEESNNYILKQEFTYYVIIFSSLTLILFIFTVAVLLIRRRSTLQANELSELRG